MNRLTKPTVQMMSIVTYHLVIHDDAATTESFRGSHASPNVLIQVLKKSDHRDSGIREEYDGKPRVEVMLEFVSQTQVKIKYQVESIRF